MQNTTEKTRKRRDTEGEGAVTANINWETKKRKRSTRGHV